MHIANRTGPFLSRLRLPESAPDDRRQGESLSAYLDRLLRSGPAPQREELEQWLRRAQPGREPAPAQTAEKQPERGRAEPTPEQKKQRDAVEARLRRLQEFSMPDVRLAAKRLGMQVSGGKDLEALPESRRLAVADALELMVKIGQIEDPRTASLREAQESGDAGRPFGGLFQRRPRRTDPILDRKLELLQRFRLSDVQRAARALGITVSGWDSPELLRSIDPISDTLEMMLAQGKVKLQE